MTSRPAAPSWLTTALSSEQHITNVLRILASRETQRVAARDISRRRVFEQINESTTKTTSSLKDALSFLNKGKKDISEATAEHYAVAAGSHPLQQHKNRYSDVMAYDRTRVVVRDGLVGLANEPSDRYLNASWVLEKAGQKWWIAAQAPPPSSAHAFLSIMLRHLCQPPHTTTPLRTRVRTVVQLTRNVESGRRKADAYFPGEVGQTLIVPPEKGQEAPALEVTLRATRKIPEADCLESAVSIAPISSNGETQTNDSISFKHLLYSSWPDHGVPEQEDRDSLLAFIHLVDMANRETNDTTTSQADPAMAADPDPPIIVGCSAGIGRTGSFIALSSLLRNYGFLQAAASPTHSSVRPASTLGPLPTEVEEDEIVQEIDSLREQRPGMVQRQEQTLLIYETLAAAYGLQLA